jgi:hypothetical protein
MPPAGELASLDCSMRADANERQCFSAARGRRPLRGRPELLEANREKLGIRAERLSSWQHDW